MTATARYYYSRGSLLSYGDAQAHLDISRSLIDSRNPGYEQLGTVWLPVLHVICLPFVGNDLLWQTGLAGTIPVAVCFIAAGVCLFLSAKEAYGSTMAAFTTLLCFALNPNVLYLATITMTEIVFVAGLALCLLAVLRFRKTQNFGYAGLAIGASWWMSLTRYDGWFLIPFVALLLMSGVHRRKFSVVVGTGALASLAPIYWMAHNWWISGNALDFYNGPYSAAAIQGNRTYPGFHDWPKAIYYYWEAGRLCCGDGLLVAGTSGLLVALWKRKWLAVFFLTLTPIFYVWSIHGSKTPIHLPSLWPFSYYNSRYGLAVVVLMAFAAGAVLVIIPPRFRWYGLFISALSVAPWLTAQPYFEGIVWRESQVNSDARRTWTAEAAGYMEHRFRRGDGVLIEFGDLAGILCKARLPLKEAVHEGDGSAWFANTMKSGLVRQTKWAIAQQDDKLSKLIAQAGSYEIVEAIPVQGAPTLLIYQRRYLGDTR